MKHDLLKVLAVGDPAVYAYADPRFAIVDKFNKENGTQVEFQIVPFTEYYPMMEKSLSKTHEFDIVMVAGHLWVKDFVEKGYLAPIAPSQDEYYDFEDILPVILDELKIEGVPYLYPSFCDGHILLYRKSLVESVLEESLPESVDTDTIIKLAEELNGYKGMSGIALKAHPSEIFLDFLPYLRQEGVDAYDPDTHLPTFANDRGFIALEKYCRLRQCAPSNTNTFGNDEVREEFQQKRVAMAVTWGGQLGFVYDDRCKDKEDVGFAALKTAWNVTWSFAIDKYSANQELANKFLQYLTSKDIDRIVGGYAGSPVRKSTYELDSEKYPWYSVHLQLIERFATPLPKISSAGARNDVLYNHVYKALTGEESPEDALKNAEREILQISTGG